MPCGKMGTQMKKHSLGTQLLVAFCLSLSVILFLVVAVLPFGMPVLNGAFQQHALAVGVEKIAAGIDYDNKGNPVELVLPEPLEWVPQSIPNDVKYAVVDKGGHILLAADGISVPFSPNGKAFDAELGKFDSHYNGLLMHVVQMATISPAQKEIYVQLAISERFINILEQGKFPFILPILTIIVSLFVIIFAMRTTLGRMLKPLHDVSVAALSIKPGNVRQRLPVENVPSELRPLINSFNQVLDRLEKGYLVQQELLASTAHELKTPLMILRGQIETEANVAAREVLLQDIDFMSRQIHQLLHFAEVSEEQNYKFASTNVASVIFDVMEYLERFAKKHNVFVEFDEAATTLEFQADRSAFFVLLKNLVENAIVHSPTGSTVTIALGEKELCVCDVGRGISREDLPNLFKRFWRGFDRQHSGAGLGLAICKEIATAHRWTLHVRDNAPGACFVVSFTDGRAR